MRGQLRDARGDENRRGKNIFRAAFYMRLPKKELENIGFSYKGVVLTTESSTES